MVHVPVFHFFPQIDLVYFIIALNIAYSGCSGNFALKINCDQLTEHKNAVSSLKYPSSMLFFPY